MDNTTQPVDQTTTDAQVTEAQAAEAKAIADKQAAAAEEEALLNSMIAEEQAAKDAKAKAAEEKAIADKQAAAAQVAAEVLTGETQSANTVSRGMTSSVLQYDEAPVAPVTGTDSEVQVAKETQAAAVAQAALAEDKTDTETKVDESPVVEAVTVVVEATAVDEFTAMVNEIKAGNNPVSKGIVFAFERYVTEMGLTNIPSAHAGMLSQKSLWQAIKHLLTGVPAEEFYINWNIALAFVHHYSNTAFNHRYVYRFAHMWDAAKTELTAFHALLDLMLMTANPATRQAKLAQVNFEAAIESEHVTEEGRSRLVSFYQ